MQSQVSELSPVLVEITVDVPWDRVAKNLDDTFAKLQKTARIKGFRPGKVPRNVVRQVFGAQVRSEVRGTIIEQALMEAFKTHELMPVAMPSVEPDELNEGKPFSFKAKIEVRPKVEAVETNALELTRATVAVKDEEITEELERLRKENATVRTPEPPRPAKEGDQLLVTYNVSIGGQDRTDLNATDRWVELGGGRLIPEIETGLVGTKPGETKDVIVKFPDDHGREDLRGALAIFKIEVKDQRERELPALDDEFAKDLGDHESLDALKTSIREKLTEAQQRRSEAQLREQVVDKLVEKNPIPVPPSLVTQQERQMVQEFAQFLQAVGQDVPVTEELTSGIRVRAERKVRAALLFGEIARREKLTVDQADIDKRLQQVADRTGKNIAKVRVEFQGERREALESDVLEDKILEYLLSQARITDGAPDAVKAEGESAGEPKAKKAKSAKKKGAAEEKDE